jgi:hypothetical protein
MKPRPEKSIRPALASGNSQERENQIALTKMLHRGFQSDYVSKH